MRKMPLIIILSGTYGVGKTTLAHQLSIDLQIMQKINLSGITTAVKTLRKNDPVVKNWDNLKNPKTIKSKLIREAKVMGEIISNVVQTAELTGENYIIEGIQLLPRFLPMDRILFFNIYLSDETEHEKRFYHPTITRTKHKNNASYSTVKKLGKLVAGECKNYPVNYIDNTGTPEEVCKKIIDTIKNIHPDYNKKYLWFKKEPSVMSIVNKGLILPYRKFSQALGVIF